MKESTKPQATLHPRADHKIVETSSRAAVAALIEQVNVSTMIKPNKISLIRSTEPSPSEAITVWIQKGMLVVHI